MRLASAITALITALLSVAGQAVAASDHVPRMERAAACSWDRPGHNPFMGDVVAAIDRYSDIPTLVRIKLKQRMQARQYDDLVDIRRDDISGRERYEPAIRDMHFGLDRVCRQVTRERWTAQMRERGLVYCEQGHCILVPTVCRNVSRIERRPTLVAGESMGAAPEATSGPASPSADPDGTAAQGPAAPTPTSPLLMAGPSFAAEVAPFAPFGPGDSDPDTPAIDLGDPTPQAFGPGPTWPAGGVGFPTDDDGDRDGQAGGVASPVSAVPEPSTWACLLAGLFALAGVSARQRKRCCATLR